MMDDDKKEPTHPQSTKKNVYYILTTVYILQNCPTACYVMSYVYEPQTTNVLNTLNK